MRCDICKLPGATQIDHLVPRSSVHYNDTDNLRPVHRARNKKPSLWQRVLRRIGYWRYKLVMWVDKLNGGNR